MSRLTKILFVVGSSAFLFQLGGCFQAADGGTSIFPLAWLFGTGGPLAGLGT